MAPNNHNFLIMLALFAINCLIAIASDPSPLQDFCVKDPNSPGKNHIHIYIYIYIYE